MNNLFLYLNYEEFCNIPNEYILDPMKIFDDNLLMNIFREIRLFKRDGFFYIILDIPEAPNV